MVKKKKLRRLIIHIYLISSRVEMKLLVIYFHNEVKFKKNI